MSHVMLYINNYVTRHQRTSWLSAGSSRVFTAWCTLIVTGDTLSVSVTICSVGAGAEKYEDMEKLSLVFLVPLLLMPVLTAC